jgi:hypothetical protein
MIDLFEAFKDILSKKKGFKDKLTNKVGFCLWRPLLICVDVDGETYKTQKHASLLHNRALVPVVRS